MKWVSLIGLLVLAQAYVGLAVSRDALGQLADLASMELPDLQAVAEARAAVKETAAALLHNVPTHSFIEEEPVITADHENRISKIKELQANIDNKAAEVAFQQKKVDDTLRELKRQEAILKANKETIQVNEKEINTSKKVLSGLVTDLAKDVGKSSEKVKPFDAKEAAAKIPKETPAPEQKPVEPTPVDTPAPVPAPPTDAPADAAAPESSPAPVTPTEAPTTEAPATPAAEPVAAPAAPVDAPVLVSPAPTGVKSADAAAANPTAAANGEQTLAAAPVPDQAIASLLEAGSTYSDVYNQIESSLSTTESAIEAIMDLHVDYEMFF